MTDQELIKIDQELRDYLRLTVRLGDAYGQFVLGNANQHPVQGAAKMPPRAMKIDAPGYVGLVKSAAEPGRQMRS